MRVLRPVISYLVKNNCTTIYCLLLEWSLYTLKKKIRYTVKETLQREEKSSEKIFIPKKTLSYKSLKSWADHWNYITTTRKCSFGCLRWWEGSKTVCQRELWGFRKSWKFVKRNTATGVPWSINPFIRNFLDVQDNGEKQAKSYASLSPDQKKCL